jgi:hypothetical protein
MLFHETAHITGHVPTPNPHQKKGNARKNPETTEKKYGVKVYNCFGFPEKKSLGKKCGRKKM